MASAYMEWNQRQDRIVIPFSTRVNLDDLFGNVHNNAICERITPCKVCTAPKLSLGDVMQGPQQLV
ncbi:unnamed protein product [Heligmosomoides polygyrus]|uniref:CACTA en-spm transposon protein n=1 Tax=Heligmosomoides polygyrus TaxID=6339 RepID=A0A183G3P6_HELPZ|nr:unnamed protein product [Heligmosomoides polygyrus]